MAFEPRKYRNIMNRERFRFFNIINKETDLWIGISHRDYQRDMEDYIENQLSAYRYSLEKHIIKYPDFLSSMHPMPFVDDSAEIIKLMLSSSSAASVGPMAAVAGAFSEMIALNIIKTFNPYEFIVENGGDISLGIKEEIVIQFYAGNNKNFEKIGISLQPGEKQLGICTSSGIYGHSFSYGKADSVTVISRSAAIADAWATAICNEIIDKEDIEIQLEKVKNVKEILSIIAVKDDKIGVAGNVKLKMIQ